MPALGRHREDYARCRVRRTFQLWTLFVLYTLLILLLLAADKSEASCTGFRILHGQVSDMGVVTCDNGFKSAENYSCANDAFANGTGLNCSAILTYCGATPTIANGRVMALSNTIYTSATLSCNEGYRLTGSKPFTCQSMTGEEGQWMGNQGCQQIPSCSGSDLLVIPNAQTITPSNGNALGSELTVVCAPGYSLSSTTQRSCQDNSAGTSATWSGDQACVVMDNYCPELTVAGAAVYHLDNRRIDSQAVINCHVQSVPLSEGQTTVRQPRATCRYNTSRHAPEWINVTRCQNDTTPTKTANTSTHSSATIVALGSVLGVVIVLALLLFIDNHRLQSKPKDKKGRKSRSLSQALSERAKSFFATSSEQFNLPEGAAAFVKKAPGERSEGEEGLLNGGDTNDPRFEIHPVTSLEEANIDSSDPGKTRGSLPNLIEENTGSNSASKSTLNLHDRIAEAQRKGSADGDIVKSNSPMARLKASLGVPGNKEESSSSSSQWSGAMSPAGMKSAFTPHWYVGLRKLSMKQRHASTSSKNDVTPGMNTIDEKDGDAEKPARKESKRRFMSLRSRVKQQRTQSNAGAAEELGTGGDESSTYAALPTAIENMLDSEQLSTGTASGRSNATETASSVDEPTMYASAAETLHEMKELETSASGKSTIPDVSSSGMAGNMLTPGFDPALISNAAAGDSIYMIPTSPMAGRTPVTGSPNISTRPVSPAPVAPPDRRGDDANLDALSSNGGGPGTRLSSTGSQASSRSTTSRPRLPRANSNEEDSSGRILSGPALVINADDSKEEDEDTYGNHLTPVSSTFDTNSDSHQGELAGLEADAGDIYADLGLDGLPDGNGVNDIAQQVAIESAAAEENIYEMNDEPPLPAKEETPTASGGYISRAAAVANFLGRKGKK